MRPRGGSQLNKTTKTVGTGSGGDQRVRPMAWTGIYSCDFQWTGQSRRGRQLGRGTRWAKAFPIFFLFRDGPACPGDRLGGTWVPKDGETRWKPLQIFSISFSACWGEGGRGLGEGEQQCPLAGCEEGVGVLCLAGPGTKPSPSMYPVLCAMRRPYQKYPTPNDQDVGSKAMAD